jgi:hypothetical protein
MSTVHGLYWPQAAYNNCSEVELDDSFAGVAVPSQATQLGEYAHGTKVAKQFGDEWFEGSMLKYDAESDLYWVLYTDGDSEELDADEARQGVLDHKQHMQPAAAVSSGIDSDEGATAPESTIAETTAAVVSQACAATAVTTPPSQSLNSGATSYTEVSTAIAALTAAAESLAGVAKSLAAQSQQQQQQQQAMFLRQQQQQGVLVYLQQQRLQQQMLLKWQQQQQQQWYWQ